MLKTQSGFWHIAVTSKRLDEEQFRETIRQFAAPNEEMMETLHDQLREYFMDEGIERGLKQGRREVLVRLLRKRFGDLPEGVTERIAQASIVELDTWAENILTAATLESVFTQA